MIEKTKRDVYHYLQSDEYRKRFRPDHVKKAAYSYIGRTGKSLRPVVLMLSCGAVGGDEAIALAAAASIEVYHTWTLVHDDIIDLDDTRRGAPTVHTEFATRGMRELGYGAGFATHYGVTMGILAGDVQQAWSVSLMCELHTKYRVNPSLVLYLLKLLTSDVQTTLIEGETLDVQYSQKAVEMLTEEEILDMLWRKTGVLYEFAGKAGAMIGLDTTTEEHPYVQSLASFASKCGTAFQLKDDVLGIVGDERTLGKPVGSDIREGKRTTVVLAAVRNANAQQRRELLEVLGDRTAPEERIEAARNLLINLGGIEYTMQLARPLVEEAIVYLDTLPDSRHKDLLYRWGEFILDRTF